jgi:hypothetical protein
VDHDHRRGLGAPRPKTVGDWIRASLRANAVAYEGMSWLEALHVVELLVQLGRTVPAKRFVDAFQGDDSGMGMI